MASLRSGSRLIAAAMAGGVGITPAIAFCAKDNENLKPRNLRRFIRTPRHTCSGVFDKPPPPQFDPEALERGAKALREINSSSHAKTVLELAKKQEETKLAEYKKQEAENMNYAKQAEVEREKIHWEEMRKTQHAQSQTKAQLARYEDELARKRMEAEHEQNRERNAELVSMQEESSKRQEVHRRVVEEQIQSERKKGAEQMAEIERETLRQKSLFEAEGRVKENRENEDVNRRQMLVRLKAEQEKALSVVNAVFNNVGAGARELLADTSKLGLLVGGITALAMGVYGAREGAKLSARLLERYLGQPALVRETSKASLNPLSWSRRSAIASSGGLAPVVGLGEVVLEPGLDARVRQLASATANYKKHGSPFKNTMFYGPPGTGKTLAARQLAKYSGLDFAIMTGGDVAPLGADAVTRLHELFDWAQSSKKGMLLFIDEADSFLGVRGRQGTSEGLRAAMNALLSRTGDQSTKIGLILATNRPSDLDEAILDRMDEMMEFGLPGPDERNRIFRAHLGKYLNPNPEGMFAAKPTPVEIPEGMEESISDVAKQTEGFSGRQLAKLAASVQGAVFGSKDAQLTPHLLQAVVQSKVVENKLRDEMADGQLHHKH